MKRAIFAAAIAAISASALQADEVPKRKPGLWEITTVAAGTGMTTIDACIGADDHIVTPADSGDCSEPKAKRTGDTIIIDVTCKRPHGMQIMSTAFTGNFTERYHGIMKITFDPPEGVPNMGVIIDGKHLGPDCSRKEGQDAAK